MTHLQWLVRARKMAGISQKEMAHRLGISTPYLCQIEAGRRRPTAVFNLIYSGL